MSPVLFARQYSLEVKLTSMNANEGAFFKLLLQNSSQICSVKWNLSLSVSHHKSTFQAPAVKKSGSIVAIRKGLL